MHGILSSLTILRATIGMRLAFRNNLASATSSSCFPSPSLPLSQQRPIFATAEYRPRLRTTRSRRSVAPSNLYGDVAAGYTSAAAMVKSRRNGSVVLAGDAARRTAKMPSWAFVPTQYQKVQEDTAHVHAYKDQRHSNRPATSADHYPSYSLSVRQSSLHVTDVVGPGQRQHTYINTRPVTTAAHIPFTTPGQYAHMARDPQIRTTSPNGNKGVVYDMRKESYTSCNTHPRPLTTAEAVAAGADPVLSSWRRPEYISIPDMKRGRSEGVYMPEIRRDHSDVPEMVRGRSDGSAMGSGVVRCRAKSKKLLSTLLIN
jgi:hypothetical protein